MQNAPNHSSAKKYFDISIIGETNLDMILYGLPVDLPVDREVLGSGFQLTLGGSSSILAHNLAVLGSKVGFTSLIGEDEMGRIAYNWLADGGVDVSHVMRSATKDTGVTVLLPHGRERRILTYLGAMSDLAGSMIDRNHVAAARHLHISSLFLQTGLQTDLPALLDEMKAKGLTLSLDTNDDPEDAWAGVLPEVLRRVDVLLPNDDEVKRMTRTATVEEALDELREQIPTVVVKCGSRGALVQHTGTRTWARPQLVEPVDSIGAGDSFNAGFLHAWLHGADPVSAAEFGNRTGALSTLRPGGTEAFRDKALREQFLQSHDLPHRRPSNEAETQLTGGCN